MTRTLLALPLAIASAACTQPAYYAPHPCDRPDLAGCVIGDVSIVGAQKVPASAIKEKIATAPTDHALGGFLADIPIVSLWDRITVDYEKLDPFVLERDMARVERLYRARGYYEAHARAARVQKTGKERVRVEIVVEEGVPVTVGTVRVVWKDNVKPSGKALAAERRAGRMLVRGAPFAEQAFEDAKKRVARALTENGYAYGTVEAKATVDLVDHRADIVFDIDPGPPTKFGKIRLEGAGGLPEDRLIQAINIKEGEPYSIAQIESAQVALSDLRVLGSVDAVPELTQGEGPRVTEVPVVFRVTPTQLKTLKFGGGLEIGSRVDVHGVAGWENKNFLGGLRSFSVEGKPGVVFFPLTLTTLFNGTPADFAVLPEMRFQSALTQPGFLEARTRGVINAAINFYQIVPTSTLQYFELAGKTGVDRDFWDSRVRVGLFANLQFDQPAQLHGDCVQSDGRSCTFVFIPYFQSTGTLDLRYGFDGKRDPVNTHSGFYLSNEVQFAWGSSRDLRWRPELRGYLPVSKKWTLALRFSGGLLYSLGGDLKTEPPAGSTGSTPGEVSRSRWVQVLQLRGFNSGGTNSNRGYAYNGVGPQEQVPGISPTIDNPADPKNPFLLPVATGGKAMWEASVELRIPLWDKLGMTVFVDGSDVRQNITDFAAPFAPHLSTGLGIRYATPVGPLRADFGVRIPGAQVIGSSCPIYDPSLVSAATPVPTCDPQTRTSPAGGFLDPRYGQAGSIRGVVPLAVSLAIGEAF